MVEEEHKQEHEEEGHDVDGRRHVLDSEVASLHTHSAQLHAV